MFCRKCGKKLDLQDKFCNICGEPVSLEAEGETTIVPEPPKDLVWNVEGFPKDKKVEDVIFDWKTDSQGEDFVVDDFYINENKNVSAQKLLDQELEKINKNNMAREEAILAAQGIATAQAVSAARRTFSEEIRSDLHGIAKKTDSYQETKDLETQSEAELESNPEAGVEPQTDSETEFQQELQTNEQPDEIIAAIAATATIVATAEAAAAAESAEIAEAAEMAESAEAAEMAESAEIAEASEAEFEATESESEVETSTEELETDEISESETESESEVETSTEELESETDTESETEMAAALAAAALVAEAAAVDAETATLESEIETTTESTTETTSNDVEALNVPNKTELKYDDLFVEEEEEPKTKGFSFGKFLLVLLILLIILEGVFLGFKYYMPENEYFKIVDEKVTQAVLTVESWFEVKEPAAEEPKVEEPVVEKPVAEEPANVFPQNKNIEEISMNPKIVYVSGKDYGNADINKSVPATERTDWVINTIVEYDSKWIDYVNSGDKGVLALTAAGSQAEKNALTFTKTGEITETFKFLEIGEVRKGSKGYYIWVREEIEILENNLTSTKVYNWIYQLTPVENQMKIVNYYSYK